MICEHCRSAVEREVRLVAGVTSVLVDLDQNTVTVSGTAPVELITQAIVEAGYEGGRRGVR
jgi:copper chaperone CopZ